MRVHPEIDSSNRGFHQERFSHGEHSRKSLAALKIKAAQDNSGERIIWVSFRLGKLHDLFPRNLDAAQNAIGFRAPGLGLHSRHRSTMNR